MKLNFKIMCFLFLLLVTVKKIVATEEIKQQQQGTLTSFIQSQTDDKARNRLLTTELFDHAIKFRKAKLAEISKELRVENQKYVLKGLRKTLDI